MGQSSCMQNHRHSWCSNVGRSASNPRWLRRPGPGWPPLRIAPTESADHQVALVHLVWQLLNKLLGRYFLSCFVRPRPKRIRSVKVVLGRRLAAVLGAKRPVTASRTTVLNRLGSAFLFCRLFCRAIAPACPGRRGSKHLIGASVSFVPFASQRRVRICLDELSQCPAYHQAGSGPIRLRGASELDPLDERDPFLVMIEGRARVKASKHLLSTERDRLELFRKITANATAYGSLARFGRRELARRKKSVFTDLTSRRGKEDKHSGGSRPVLLPGRRMLDHRRRPTYARHARMPYHRCQGQLCVLRHRQHGDRCHCRRRTGSLSDR